MENVMAEHYGEDLAYIHDVGHRHWVDGAGPGVLELLRKGGVTQGRVVDLGCGGGIWAKELCRSGYKVTGIDISAAMIALARERAPEATFRRGSLFTAKLPRCDAVTSLGECVNYSFDAQAQRDGAMGRFFVRVHDALRSGGLFIFDVRRPQAASPVQGHRAGPDWAVMFRAEEDAAGRELTRHITAFRKVGRLYRRSEEVHRLRLYKSSELATMLRRAGFRVRILGGYGKFRFRDTHAGFVARKA
jgi:SAM-dependent methyltransferase